MQIWGGKLENSFLSTLNFPDMIKIISQKETQKLKRQCKHGDWSYIKFYAKLAPFNETFINRILPAINEDFSVCVTQMINVLIEWHLVGF